MPLTRRELLKVFGVAAGGVGLTTAGYERLIPFIHQPDEIVPGVSTWYATSCRECPAGCGMLVRNREARIVKCEGNPIHPINSGTLCARGQAALHGIYDPDRIKSPMRRSGSGFEAASWDDALSAIGDALARRPRIAFISDLQTGSLEALMRQWLSALGSDRFVVYEPINYEGVKSAAGGVVPAFNIGESDYLISLGADFLETWVSPVEYSRHFAKMREIKDGSRGGYVHIGPRMSMTAANADEHILVPPNAISTVALAIASEAGVMPRPGPSIEEVAGRYDLDPNQLRRVAGRLRAASDPLVLPGGDPQSARAAMQINAALGSTLVNRNRPHAVTYIASREEMSGLISAMRAGQVDVLIVYGANPVYQLPKSAEFIKALERVGTVLSLSSFMDETSTHADWILPSNTPLESWGDYRPYPDVANLIQPTMGQLNDTRHTGDILIELAGSAGLDPQLVFRSGNWYEYLRLRWGVPVEGGEGPESSAPEWENLVRQGGRWGAAVEQPAPTAPGAAEAAGEERPEESVSEGQVHLWAFPHIYYYDGRNANRRWLQEMPEPMTNTAWTSWAELHPSTARKLGVSTEDMVEISREGASVSVPVFVWRGVAPDTVAVSIGQGHDSYGRYASGTGVNVLPLLGEDQPIVSIRKTGGGARVTRWKGADSQHGRDIVRTTFLGERVPARDIKLPVPEGYKFEDFYPGHEHARHRWAMVIDLDRCIGCHACVIACYAENNVGVVGAEQIRRKREMAWLRIDRYVNWNDPYTPIAFQPMLCQHCDSAPCEPVCPVYAAAHSDDGINMQIYNRCVGTRYCSNNCPYKVRRFNWFDYDWPEPLNWQLNPDVTVRSRGVMEKCTFCVQRIREIEIIARREGRPIRDGEIAPACVQTCPTRVFTFGNLMDPESQVSKLVRGDPRAYQVLSHLNTKPAVIYLRRIVERI